MIYLWNIPSFPVDLKCLTNQVFLCWGGCSVYNAKSLSWQTLRNNCDFLKFVWLTRSASVAKISVQSSLADWSNDVMYQYLQCIAHSCWVPHAAVRHPKVHGGEYCLHWWLKARDRCWADGPLIVPSMAVVKMGVLENFCVWIWSATCTAR